MSTATLGHRLAVTSSFLLLAAMGVLSVWHGGRMAWADVETLAARWTISDWRRGRGPVITRDLWARKRDDLRLGLQFAPDSAQLLDDLGYLYSSRAIAMAWPKYGSEEDQLRQSLLTDAIINYRAATVLRPTFPYSWAYLALTKQLRGELDSEFWVAFDKALQYGRNESGLQLTLAEMAFAQGKALSPERQQLVFSMIISSQGAVRKQLAALIDQNGVTVPSFGR